MPNSGQGKQAVMMEANIRVVGGEEAAAEPAPNSSFKPTLFLISGRMLAFVVTFFIPIILSRVFTTAAFGEYKQVFLVYATFYGLAQVGMAESLYYFLPHDRERAARYVFNSMLVLGVSGLCCLGVLAGGAQLVSRWVGIANFSRHAVMLWLYLLMTLVSTALEITMINRSQYRRAAVVYAASDILRAVFLVLPAVLFHSVDALLRGIVIFAALRLAGALFYMWREFGSQMRFDLGLLRSQFGYAMPFQLAGIVDIAQTYFHQYAVSATFPVAVFAVYSVGCLQLPFVDFVANPACNVMMVRMGEQLRAGRDRAVLLLWRDTTRKLALIFTPLFVLLLISARQIIQFLFPPAYRAATPIFMLWSAIVILAIFQTDGLMRVYAQTGFLVLLNTIRLAVIVTLVWWCMRTFGLSGAVLVTLIATATAKLLAMWRGSRLMHVSFQKIVPWGNLLVIGVVAAAATLPALLIRARLAPPDAIIHGHFALRPLAAMMAMGAAYSVSYGAMLFGFGLLEEHEKLALTAWVRRKFSRPALAPPESMPDPMVSNATPADGD